jgi:antitoxin component of RelBE/YafQ-DinJ toxin-antitoxin module
MDTKLTLKLNERVIERAKKYSSNKKISLSRLIENYLDSLTKDQDNDFEISPFVKSIATGKSIPIDADWKEERDKYSDHLDEKYK